MYTNDRNNSGSGLNAYRNAKAAGEGLKYWREKINDPELLNSARAEFAKVGFDVEEVMQGDARSDSEKKTQRASLRRAVNALQDSVQKDPKGTAANDARYKAYTQANQWASAVINLTTEFLEAEEDGRDHMLGRSPSAALRDVDGNRVGILLSNETLRSQSQIASQLGAHSTGEDPSLGEFFRGIANMKTPQHVRNALSEGTNTAGGYTVPTVLLPGILNALVPASSLLNAGVSIGVLDTQQASSFNIAGISTIPTPGWRSEAGAVAESDPAFRSIAVTPRSLAFRFKVSRELLADSPDIDEALRTVVAAAFAKEIDRAGLRGTGTAPEIRGLLNTAGIQAVTNGANGASLTSYANFISAMQAVKTVDAPDPTAAIMHPRSGAKLAGLVDTTNQPLRRPPALEPWKLLTTSQIPVNLTVGSSTDCSEIYVGDFSKMVLFMREGVSIQLVSELYAETGQIGFVCHTRIDVAVLYPAAFALITGVKA